jgi:hypothetical protein
VGNQCCTLNACGQCGPTPQEVCDGIDNDCNGIVDDPSEIGIGPNCPMQMGVCAGTTGDCRGAQGWVCDTTTYMHHSAQYQTIETACDNLDNDCDGTADHIHCGTSEQCRYDFCESGLCTAGWNDDNASVCQTMPASPPTTPNGCHNGQCLIARLVAICTGPYDATHQTGHNCAVYDPNNNVTSVDGAACGGSMATGGAYLIEDTTDAMGNPVSSANGICDYCDHTMDGTRFACVAFGP